MIENPYPPMHETLSECVLRLLHRLARQGRGGFGDGDCNDSSAEREGFSAARSGDTATDESSNQIAPEQRSSSSSSSSSSSNGKTAQTRASNSDSASGHDSAGGGGSVGGNKHGLCHKGDDEGGKKREEPVGVLANTDVLEGFIEPLILYRVSATQHGP